MATHILNGDALATQLKGQFSSLIVMRECLIEGPVKAQDIAQFWKKRSVYLEKYSNNDGLPYVEHVQSEIEKVKRINEESEICLWFEFDVYCQVNMWFIMSYIHSNSSNRTISWVFPNHPDWKGFGMMDKSNLDVAFTKRRKLSLSEQTQIAQLWKLHQEQDYDIMTQLPLLQQSFFNMLRPTVEALIDLNNNQNNNRVTTAIKKLIHTDPTISFGHLFHQFSTEHGIYGFGDLQLLEYYNKLRTPE